MVGISRSNLGSLFLVAVSCLTLVGCGRQGPKIVPVSGKVTMNGKPLTGYVGFLRVVPEGERAATGRIDPADGSFSLTTYSSDDGCVLGKHPVAVIVNTMVGTELVWLIPEHYGDHATSELNVDIVGETDSLEIELTGTLKPYPKKPAGGSETNPDDVF